MFTEEEKIRAIELYFKYGKKLAPVIRELGYPSKRNLRRWIRSWEAGGGAKVVSWSLSTRPDAELVNTMLDNAVETLNAGERPVIHSDSNNAGISFYHHSVCCLTRLV